MTERRRVGALATAVVLVFYAALAALAIDASFDSNGTELDAAGGSEPSRRSDAGADAAVGDDSGAADGTAGETASGAPAGAGGRASGGSAAGGAKSTGGGTSGGSAGRSTGGTIKIGVHDDNPGAAFGQFGVKGGPSSDQGQWVVKVVDWINAHGGMGGRKVELVHHVTESLNGSFDEQSQRACTFFTEDNDVAAVVGGARVPSLNLIDCLAGHDTPLVWNYQYMVDNATLTKYRNHLYMPAMVSADRLGVWMDAMAADGFFTGGVIGVVRYENPIHKYLVDKVLKPRLAARGLSVTEEAAFRGATGAGSAADLSAQANNAVLRFQSRGVNRVIFVPTSAVLPLLWFVAAESQQFRPRYTMTSYDVPDFQTANAPGSQLRGARAFGWTPAGDVAWEQQPKPLSPSAQRCVEITAGADPPGNGSVRRFCDGLFFLKAILDRGHEPTTAGIKAGAEALGTSYDSAWTLSASFAGGRRDAATTGRVVSFMDACGCFQYTGPSIPIP